MNLTLIVQMLNFVNRERETKRYLKKHVKYFSKNLLVKKM